MTHYPGPPPTVRPTAGPVGVPALPEPPRMPPPQNHAAIDTEEDNAAALTRAIGIGFAMALALLITAAVIREILN